VIPEARFPTYEAEERRRSALPTGVEAVPLTGTPAPALPDHVVDAVAAALARRMKTPPANGLAALRRALATELERSTGRVADPETEVLVTNGAMQALGVCFRSLLEPGDEVVVPTPCFFFGGPIHRAGGVPVYVPGTEADGWRWDVEALERAVGPRTRALMLCNPGNPTGHVPSPAEVTAVVSLAERRGLVVVTDEAYEAGLWQGATLSSAFGLGGEVIVIRSLGKSLSMPQLRIGMLAGPAHHVARCTRALEWDCLRVNVASQEAALAALEGPRDWLELAHAGLEEDRATAVAAVAATPGLAAVTPGAAPFLFVGSSSGDDLASPLEQVGLPVVDGAAFEAPGYARLPFGGAVAAAAGLRQALDCWARLHAL
jgi:aspartate/methionine/tyrosine aminotransferase